MARCVTVVNYSIKNHQLYGDQPIFCVEHLSDRMFHLGFRILNPEFTADPWRIKTDSENLKELLNELDHQDELAFETIKHDYMSARKREERRNPGGDRSTPPVVY